MARRKSTACPASPLALSTRVGAELRQAGADRRNLLQAHRIGNQGTGAAVGKPKFESVRPIRVNSGTATMPAL